MSEKEAAMPFVKNKREILNKKVGYLRAQILFSLSLIEFLCSMTQSGIQIFELAKTMVKQKEIIVKPRSVMVKSN